MVSNRVVFAEIVCVSARAHYGQERRARTGSAASEESQDRQDGPAGSGGGRGIPPHCWTTGELLPLTCSFRCSPFDLNVTLTRDLTLTDTSLFTWIVVLRGPPGPLLENIWVSSFLTHAFAWTREDDCISLRRSCGTSPAGFYSHIWRVSGRSCRRLSTSSWSKPWTTYQAQPHVSSSHNLVDHGQVGLVPPLLQRCHL